LRARLCDAFEVFGAAGLERYLWHCDRLVMEIELGDDANDEPHLAGHLRTGDGAEDEWFLAFLLQRLSAARPDTSCHIVDADGELLLIEAALAAPRWLTPDNAEHRVWLRNGKVHILPKPRPPESNHLSCREALAKLRAPGAATVAKDKVQHAINSRLEGFPTRALELSTHVAKAVLPSAVARLLLAFPQLVSIALDNLPPPATQELIRMRKALTGPAANVRFDCEAVSEKDMICVGIRFTRCQYARLMGMRSQLPQKFTQKHWRPAGGKVCEKTMRVGAMLCAGLDAAFLQDPQSATPALRWPAHELNEALLPEIPPWFHDAQFAQHAADLQVPLRFDSPLTKRAFEQQRSLDEPFRPALMAAMKHEAVKGMNLAKFGRADDSDDWLQISGEDLDREMQRRQDEFDAYDSKRATSGPGGEAASGRAEAAASETEPDKLREELAAMGKEISGMLERASCLEGVEATAATGGSRETSGGGNADDSDSDGSNEIDVLGMEDDNLDDPDSDGEDGELRFSEEEMREYMAALDEQLEEQEGLEEQTAPEPTSQSAAESAEQDFPMTSHHIKVDDSAPLELDLHAMEHLLASFCSEHHFEPGPASLLLGELGLAGGTGGYRGKGQAGSLDSMD